MNRAFTLVSASPDARGVSLRTIEAADLEDLRAWKNANRQAFFFKDEITTEGQKLWFQGYLARLHDYMFIVEAEGGKAGCMGFRVHDGDADCYNIIAAPGASGKGRLGAAMRLMCSYALAEAAKSASCLVLKGNPALAWYEKQGFKPIAERPDHFRLELDAAEFRPARYVVKAPR